VRKCGSLRRLPLSMRAGRERERAREREGDREKESEREKERGERDR